MISRMQLIVVALVLSVCLVALGVSEETPNKCECGAFDFAGEKAPDSMQPLMSQKAMDITCDAEGARNCQQLCVELVKLGKERAPEILCAQIKHSDGLKPSLFTRTCNGDWIYSGLTCEHVICCHDGHSVACTG